jgi:hypothetical protein
MVLEDASPIGSEAFSDDAPDSDSDPYSTSGSPTSALMLDTSKFPKPFPILGPMFGYNGQLLSKLVQKRVDAAAKVLERPTTEDEATAIAYWTAKQVAVTSWGAPLGIAAGAWRAYQTADTFRFPFYKPEPDTFRALAWPSSRAALLSGPTAVAAWHATRLLAYGFMGTFIGRILLTSYGMSVATVGEITDPRLKNYVERVRKVAQSARGKLPNESQRPGKVGEVQKKDATTTWKGRTREIGDNASPDIEDYGDTKTSESPAIVEDAVMPDPNTKTPERGSRLSRETYPRGVNAGPSQTEGEAQSFDDSFDEVSPTGGRGMEDTVAAGGSAWDRIRRQASSQAAGNRESNWPARQTQQAPRPDQRAWMRDSQRHPRQGPETGDSISYSKSEEERQLARAEAQKEFDARVEQERRGGDFSSDNGAKGDGKSWQTK